ncbi:EamA family transporter [Lewinella sp. IMCC34183]|uniref:EamA family transporter n=1 Tax=Lewinella sp. IMCC34183 TaxID=2248762 RepID=UPI000E24A69E|nr:DMT family transporter [Lewinella sp. IMCC34183]
MTHLRGVLCIIAGAASYGVLATGVKLANLQGHHTAVLTFFQFLFGAAALSLAVRFGDRRPSPTPTADPHARRTLLLYGTSLGFTSCFYYLSLRYVPVSIAIILLMQTIWMGTVLEMILTRSRPERLKTVGSLVVLVGTALAVNIFDNLDALDPLGVAYGLLASMAYTVTLLASNKVAVELPDVVRSKYLVLGGFVTILLFWNVQIVRHFHLDDVPLLLYGLFLAVFGTILPPVLFSRGFPVVGVGIGSILAAVEIPVSILSANVLLDEQVRAIQWIGVGIIILSVVLINYQHLRRETKLIS